MRRAATRRTAVKIACTVLSFCLLFSACGHAAAPVSRTGFAMGSLISVSVYADEATANGIAETVFREIAALDARISATDENSETARLNRGETVTLSPETAALLRETLALCGALGSRLDITLGSVTALWGFSADAPRLPAEDEIKTALAAVGAEKIAFEGDTVTLAPGQKLDFGATGKGEGCDIARAALQTAGSAPAAVSFGGTVLLYGQKPGSPWTVGVRDPFGTAQELCGTFTFTPETAADCCVISTSGSYEKNFTENGKTYHHILDPDTGYPVENGLAAVTAVSHTGRLSDALSTALFVNGLNDVSLSWIEEYLIGAVFVFEDGGVWVSEGLRGSFTLENTGRFYLKNDET